MEYKNHRRFLAEAAECTKEANAAAYLIALPMCISRRHCGASPSSAQYSSMEAIFPSAVFMKDTAWKDALLSFG